MVSLKKDWCLIVSQPELEVIASGASGTSVTCVGFIFNTKQNSFQTIL